MDFLLAHLRCEDHYYALYPSTYLTNKKNQLHGFRSDERGGLSPPLFIPTDESVCNTSVWIYGLSNDTGPSCTHSTPHLVNAHENPVFLKLRVSVQLKPGVVSRRNECGLFFSIVHHMKTSDHQLSCLTNSAAILVN